MSETSKFISKPDSDFWFASAAGPQAAQQYKTMSPSKLLETVITMMSSRSSKGLVDSCYARLPDVLAYTDWDSRGRAIMGQIAKKDVDLGQSNFVGPSGGQNPSTVKGLGLIPLLASDSIMEGAAPLVCARDVFQHQTMNSPNESMPFFTASVYLKPNGFGTEANDIAQDVGKNMLKCMTFRCMAKLAKELVRDSAANIKADALKEIGKAHEMTLNRYAFTKMIDFAGRDVSMGASGTATNMIDAVLAARAGILNDGFVPDKVVLWPTGEYKFFKKLNPYYNVAAQQLVEKAGPIRFGNMSYYTTAVSAAAANEIYNGTTAISTGYTFDGTTTSTSKAAGSIYAMVMDSNRMGRMGILEEMELVEFDDPIKYLEVPIADMRWDVAMAFDDQNSTNTNSYSVEDVYYHT